MPYVEKSVWTMRVEANDPVSQDLPTDAGNLCSPSS